MDLLKNIIILSSGEDMHALGFDEGIRKLNNYPLPVECLLMEHSLEQLHEADIWERLHYHKYIELLYVVEGSFEVYINGDVYPLLEGDASIINAGELHATRRKSVSGKLLCIKFMPEILFSSEQTVTEMEYAAPYVFEHFGLDRCFTHDLLHTTFLPQAFEQIIRENAVKAFGYEMAIRAEVMRIFAWILRYWYIQNGPDEQPAPREAEIIRKAREYVDQHFAEATLQRAAEHCCLSYSYFSRLFSRCMRMSFSQYVNLKRINFSMKELVLSDRSITDIAMAAGFSSVSYYIHTFRKIKNISPMQFRKRFTQNKTI